MMALDRGVTGGRQTCSATGSRFAAKACPVAEAVRWKTQSCFSSIKDQLSDGNGES